MSAPPPVILRLARVVEERASASELPRLWSARAVAAHWSVSRMFIYRLHSAGRLPGYRVAGVLRFLEGDLLQLLREEGVPVRTESVLQTSAEGE